MSTFKKITGFLIAAAMMFMLGCASTHKQEGTGEYIDDSVITAKVKAVIFEESTLKSAEINVETFKGTVQLSGFVDTADQKAKAEAIAAGVTGVTSVRNNITLKTAAAR